MIETPSAVMLSKELISEVDFEHSSNDLLEYTVALERALPWLRKDTTYFLRTGNDVEIIVKREKRQERSMLMRGIF